VKKPILYALMDRIKIDGDGEHSICRMLKRGNKMLNIGIKRSCVLLVLKEGDERNPSKKAIKVV